MRLITAIFTLSLISILSIFLISPARLEKSTVYASGPLPTISIISDSGQTGKFNKFEVNAAVTTQATNYFLPYDPMTLVSVPGLSPGKGVSVDGIFLPPSANGDWSKAYKSPGFYFVDYSENGTLYLPTGNNYWKIRFAPNEIGSWQYKLSVIDTGGSSESTTKSFSVVSSTNHGFIQVSKSDPRYFEFSDGTYFPDLIINALGNIDKNNPLSSSSILQTWGSNGIQVVRFWLENWPIYGSAWTQWEGIRGDTNGTYFRNPNLITNNAQSTATEPSSVMTLVYSESNGVQNQGSWFDACDISVSEGSQVRMAVKQNTSYHIKIRYQAKGITGPRNPAFAGYGFVLKRQNPNDGNWHTQCYNGGDPANGVKLTGYGQDTPNWNKDSAGNWFSPNWSTLESDWNSGSNTSTPILYLALENANNLAPTIDGGKTYNWHPYVYIDSIEIRENLSGGGLGPNIVYRSSMSYLENINDRYAYAFDKIVNLAEQNGVYLKTVLIDKNVQEQKEIDASTGVKASADVNNFFGNWRYLGAVRWYQFAYFRYAQARWGYSTAIHSWELTNEGDVANGNHNALADELGKYMHCLAFDITSDSSGKKFNFPKG